MTTTDRERAAREKAHELLHRGGAHCIGAFTGIHGATCDRVTAHLLSIEEAHAAEVEGLRRADNWLVLRANSRLEAVALRADLARVTAERDYEREMAERHGQALRWP
jgi:hypothetical protein